MPAIVVVGSINADLFTTLPHWPARGETIAATAFTESPGGKGANQAIAAARLGASVCFIGAVGDDARGETLAQTLADEGIALTLARKPGVSSGLALIDIGPDGDNLIRLVGGANQALTVADVPEAPFAGADIVLLQNEIPLAVSLAAAHAAKRAGAMVIMDPAPAPTSPWPRDTLSAFDLITPNATEAAQLTGIPITTREEGLRAAKALATHTGGGALITLGPLGAAWFTPTDGEGHCAPPPAKTVDTVAAGDCFNAALAVAMSQRHPFPAAASFACQAAALSTTRPGSVAALPFASELTPPPSTSTT